MSGNRKPAPGARLEAVAEGRFTLSERLDFPAVEHLLRHGPDPVGEAAEGDTVEIDLSALEHADSAALALFTQWLRQARSGRCRLRLLHPPKQLLTMARLSGVEGLLFAEEAE